MTLYPYFNSLDMRRLIKYIHSLIFLCQQQISKQSKQSSSNWGDDEVNLRVTYYRFVGIRNWLKILQLFCQTQNMWYRFPTFGSRYNDSVVYRMCKSIFNFIYVWLACVYFCWVDHFWGVIAEEDYHHFNNITKQEVQKLQRLIPSWQVEHFKLTKPLPKGGT